LFYVGLPDTNDSKLLQSSELGSKVEVHRILKNGVYFSTKPLRQLASKKQDLSAEYDRYQRQVVEDAMNIASSYTATLQEVSRLVSHLDVLVALAHVAAYNAHGFCRPELTDSSDDGQGIHLVQGRHPCVELQENVDFIPNDMRLIFGQSNFLLVTGPNMGGKSTYIRSVGAIVALAQIGSFVPCESAKMNICHSILTRVGAGESLLPCCLFPEQN
jgi:DNA mismatch repair protein MSH2